MKKLLSLFLITVILGGCSKIYQIQLPENAKNLLEQKNGTIHLTDNLQFEIDKIHVFGDSLAFTDKKTDSAKTIALRDIVKVDRLSRGLSISQGIVFTIAALGFEYIWISQLPHKRNAESVEMGSYILGGTLIGGVLGTLAHSKLGSQESYIFNRDSLIAHSSEKEKQEPLIGDDKPEMKKVFKTGIELGEYLTRNTGSFSNTLGFSIGYLTGINLYRMDASRYVLGIDVSYNRSVEYRTNVKRDYISEPFNYHHVSDERYRLSIVELEILPEYLYSINDNVTLGFYGGGSIGLGTEILSANEISRSIIDSTYCLSSYGPYGEYNMDASRLPYGVSIGSSVYFKHWMIDLRYRYTNMNSKYSFVKEFQNLYLQFGCVL
jgi:hypothetical protein